MPNLSVWTSAEALRKYAYSGEHGVFFKRRSEWFEPSVPGAGPTLVLWWMKHGDPWPTVQDGMEMLRKVRADGPSKDAFTFQKQFPSPSSDEEM